ncbi:unnamed protein product [marine sediment metagenome]|uniref:Uncharacterized protein n=1 Tax=marine sediment metagenome TaxID=412755 RepID=X1E966_9ZZZZ
MVYKKDDWALYKKVVTLRGGRNQTIYFFSKHKPKSGEQCDKPENMEMGVNERTGLPYLKKK